MHAMQPKNNLILSRLSLMPRQKKSDWVWEMTWLDMKTMKTDRVRLREHSKRLSMRKNFNWFKTWNNSRRFIERITNN